MIFLIILLVIPDYDSVTEGFQNCFLGIGLIFLRFQHL